MRSFILIKAFLLCSYSWVSVSGSESQTVQVQPGEEITPLCPNISTTPTQTDWLRLVNRTKSSCVSSLYESEGSPSFCHGFQNGKYEMSSNVSTVFLKIKHVDLSDSGLYFCGFYIKKHTVIAEVIELSVQGETSDGRINLITVILGSLTVLLTIVIVGLAVKIRKLQTGTRNNRGPDHLNYAALSFQAKPKRNRRPASERQLEPNDTSETAAQHGTDALTYSSAFMLLYVDRRLKESQ
uniref:Immunoglobulin domain-containing protein n=1 Tax=Mastacembelus armatus TaxID=205130 RepID=A0A3Q3RQW2_9TELE